MAMIVVGLLVALGGLWVVFGNGSYQSTETAAKVGPLTLQTTSDKTIPVPIGYGLIVVGGVLLAVGALRKR
ncbi:MAG: hypothetical protein KGI40_11840 [Xanthomonadaceae bacterium]|nr:hypothetical protein [Xanthomonadaceae bacterium]